MPARTARVTIDARRVSPAAVRQAVQGTPMVVLTVQLLGDLAEELGSMDAAVGYLLEVVEEVGRPIGANIPTMDGSRTWFIGPRTWSQERLAGYVAGHHAELEAEFGEVTRAGRSVPAPGGGADGRR